MPARANRSDAVIDAKHARLGEPHIAPFVALADEIAEARGLVRGTVPYPDPHFAGVGAEALVLLKSPGPKTARRGGSGLLSVENDDPTAARCYDEYRRVGVDWRRLLHWNTVPWPTDSGAPTAADLRDARQWLPRLLELVPDIKAVLLLGKHARDEWRRPGLGTIAVGRRVSVIEGPMPSNLGMLHDGAPERLRAAIDDLAAAVGQDARPVVE